MYGAFAGFREAIFLPFMCSLRFFEIYVVLSSATLSFFDILSFLMGSLCISLTSLATWSSTLGGRDYVRYNSYRFIANLCDADVWTRLDSITTHPAGSRLQGVVINIDYTLRYDDYRQFEPVETRGEVVRSVLDSLLVYLYFSRKALCSSKSYTSKTRTRTRSIQWHILFYFSSLQLKLNECSSYTTPATVLSYAYTEALPVRV
jgi:hypothetical protein